MADPKIKYDIEAAVKGGADVNKLASEIDALAGTLDGDLKNNALAAADALRQLGAKDAAIDNFVNLKREATSAAAGLQDAQAAAQKMGAELASVQTPTRAQAGQMQKLRDAVNAAKAEVIQQNTALMQARGTLAQYGVSTDNLSQSQRNIKTAIAATKTEVVSMASAAKAAADQQVLMLAKEEAAQRNILGFVTAKNAKAVAMAKSEAAAREEAAQRSIAAEKQRQAVIEQIQLKESLAQQALIARSREIAAQYPRLAAAAQNAGNSQVQSNKQVETGLDSLKNQLNSLRNVAVAALGGSYVGSLAKDVAATADSYNNLQARIKLATGETVAFTPVFQAVSEVAFRTNTALESTGNLFGKLTEAGKSSGQSTQAAIAQSLQLTETIGQAIQLSGASQQASDAAITQLIQGLQSGVLRGEEFNSVMEQSPRLAKALADGLGATTGELRKMANAGQLTTDVVIKSLQGQADVVAAEFSKLPPTVGRAIQNLSSAWTIYVGETDKATGASSAAASAINLLSTNLKTVAGFLLDAGQAAAALVAIRLAQHFLGIGAAATQATAAVAANTAAVTAAGAAGNTAAVGVGRLASILSSLKTFTLLGLVTNFQDIGTAIGEAAAKLMGYKDRTDELARADKVAAQIAADAAEQRRRMATATQAAIDKQFELSKAAAASIAEFDAQTKAGKSAADAIAKIGKDFDLASVPGIRDATAVLDKLAADGKISAETLQAAWANALKGEDLASFEVRARAAFDGSAREAERLAQVLDATLREAIRRAGLDFDVISGGMSKASQSAINDTEAMINGLDRLKAMGVDTAAALTASLGKGIDTADTQKALDTVRSQIEAVRKALGDKVADGLLDQAAQKALALGDALDKAKPGINSVREAMKELGVVTDQTLKIAAEKSKTAYDTMRNSGLSSARELADGFKKYAEAAIAANGGVASEAIKSEAAMRGLEIQTDRTGKAIVRSMGEGKRSTDDFTRSVQSSIGAINQQTSAMEDQAKRAADRANKLQGQNAVDNRLMFQVRDKLNAGTLTADDAKDVQAVLAALKQNAVINAFGRSQGGISLAGIEDDQKWQNTGAVLQQWVNEQGQKTTSTATPSTQSTTTQAKSYTVNVNLGGTTTAINTSSDADAQALINVLKRAQLSA